jgi:hypothetical protein
LTLSLLLSSSLKSGDLTGEPAILTIAQNNPNIPNITCLKRLARACPGLQGLGQACLNCTARHLPSLTNQSSLNYTAACVGELPSTQFYGSMNSHFYCGAGFPSFFVGFSPIAEYCVDYIPILIPLAFDSSSSPSPFSRATATATGGVQGQGNNSKFRGLINSSSSMYNTDSSAPIINLKRHNRSNSNSNSNSNSSYLSHYPVTPPPGFAPYLSCDAPTFAWASSPAAPLCEFTSEWASPSPPLPKQEWVKYKGMVCPGPNKSKGKEPVYPGSRGPLSPDGSTR